MTLTRTRRTALTFGCVVAIVSVALFVIYQTSRSTFSGTDVEYFDASAQPGVVDCEHQPGSLESLVAESDLIVLGTVTAERPLFESAYGTDLPREVNGVLPERRSDFLPQALQIDVEKVLSGTMPESLEVQALVGSR